MVPPVMPVVIIIVIIGIIVAAIVVSWIVVVVSGIVIVVVIRSIVPRPTAKGDTESLCPRIISAYRQQSQDCQRDNEESFH